MRTKSYNEMVSLRNKAKRLSFYWKKKIVKKYIKNTESSYTYRFTSLINYPADFKTTKEQLHKEVDAILKGMKDRTTRKEKSSSK